MERKHTLSVVIRFRHLSEWPDWTIPVFVDFWTGTTKSCHNSYYELGNLTNNIIGAVMRKLVHIMCGVLKSGQAFEHSKERTIYAFVSWELYRRFAEFKALVGSPHYLENYTRFILFPANSHRKDMMKQ